MKTIKTVIASLICLAVSWSSQGQDWKTLGVDELFSIARKEVFGGKRMEGREKLKYVLEKSPGYDDVRIFLARTYSWDGLYEEARHELQAVMKNKPILRDVIDALIDVELWSDHYDDALRVAQKGLITYPNDEDFLYKQASALVSLDRRKEALLTLNRLLQINPTHEKGVLLYKNINLHNLKYEAVVTYGTDFFSRLFDPAHYASAQVSRTNSWGSAHVRFNYTWRLNGYGSQFEADLYPTVARGIYAYLSYGYSGSDLFPENRMGAELFFKLPKSLEASAGIRYMDFGQDKRILVYTGSWGWYFKNYWLSIRPYVTPDPETGTSVSATIFLRRYFSSAENYFGLNAGFGFSPDIRRIQNGTRLSENEIFLLKSQRAGLTWQRAFCTTWIFKVSVDVARQELVFDRHDWVIITSSSLSVRKKI